MTRRAFILQLIVLGWYIALSLLLPFGMGLWLDQKVFKTFPLLALLGLGLGTIIMIYGVHRMVHRFQETAMRQEKNDSNI